MHEQIVPTLATDDIAVDCSVLPVQEAVEIVEITPALITDESAVDTSAPSVQETAEVVEVVLTVGADNSPVDTVITSAAFTLAKNKPPFFEWVNQSRLTLRRIERTSCSYADLTAKSFPRKRPRRSVTKWRARLVRSISCSKKQSNKPCAEFQFAWHGDKLVLLVNGEDATQSFGSGGI